MTYTAVDISWPQGPSFRAPDGSVFVGVGAVSLDGGTPFVQSTYAAQVDTAHSMNLPVVHYAFNGRTTSCSPAQLAIYLIAHSHDYRPGFDAIALDVESSEKGTYPAWTPAEADQFRAQLVTGLQYKPLIVYGNETDMSRPGWGAVEQQGCFLWIAWPGPESALRFGEWSDWTIWQNTITNGVDHDVAKKTIADILGTTSHPQEDDVKVIYQATSSEGVIFQGWRYLQGDDGTLRALSAADWQVINWTWQASGHTGDYPCAQWTGADIQALASKLGLYEFTGTLAEGDPHGLTGKIIGRNATAVAVDGSTDGRAFPQSTAQVDSAALNTAVSSAVNAAVATVSLNADPAVVAALAEALAAHLNVTLEAK